MRPAPTSELGLCLVLGPSGAGPARPPKAQRALSTAPFALCATPSKPDAHRLQGAALTSKAAAPQGAPPPARRADAQAPASASTNVVLRHDGAVRWDAPAITRSSCRVDVSAFPFDAQRCGLTFGSWTHSGHQLDVQPRGAAASLADFVENVEWRVLGMPARRRVLTYGCCSEPYPDVTFTLLLRRRAAAYVCNLLLPCVLISLLAPLAFHLPADSGEKVSLGVTVLLALTVFQLLLAESMPPAESVPLIGEL